MGCPNCGCTDYFELISKDCANRQCKYFNNGKAVKTSTATFRGWAVIRKGRPLPCEEYVFATASDATKWKDINGLFEADVRSVASPAPFKWQPSRGTVRGIILADRLYVIHKERPDSGFHGSYALVEDA